MKSYRVIWEIDIEAESPEDAAREAMLIQHDPTSWASVFDVYDADGNQTQVDLSAIDEFEYDNGGSY